MFAFTISAHFWEFSILHHLLFVDDTSNACTKKILLGVNLWERFSLCNFYKKARLPNTSEQGSILRSIVSADLTSLRKKERQKYALNELDPQQSGISHREQPTERLQAEFGMHKIGMAACHTTLEKI